SLSASFFYAHSPHCTLHSFPTRRSSDLGPRQLPVYASAERRGRPWPTCGLIGDERQDAVREQRQIGQQDGVAAAARGRRTGDAQDRKSTRLNSSHVAISYAVFCLKKKKK